MCLNKGFTTILNQFCSIASTKVARRKVAAEKPQRQGTKAVKHSEQGTCSYLNHRNSVNNLLITYILTQKMSVEVIQVMKTKVHARNMGSSMKMTAKTCRILGLAVITAGGGITSHAWD